MKAQYLMVGGFLGAGKTTALFRAASNSIPSGPRRADHERSSDALVDTAIVGSRNLPVEEIAGWLLLLPVQPLVDAASRLERDAAADVLSPNQSAAAPIWPRR